MDYEKKYKEALVRAKESMKDGGISSNTITYLESIFPELCESDDEKIRKKIIDYFRGSVGLGVAIGGVSVKDIVSWLEKQCEQKPVEWSEEDEKYFNILISLINNPSSDGIFDYHQINKSAFNNWLKSLKDRYTWKPSEEQIHHLSYAVDCFDVKHTKVTHDVLLILLEQLKAL